MEKKKKKKKTHRSLCLVRALVKGITRNGPTVWLLPCRGPSSGNCPSRRAMPTLRVRTVLGSLYFCEELLVPVPKNKLELSQFQFQCHTKNGTEDLVLGPVLKEKVRLLL